MRGRLLGVSYGRIVVPSLACYPGERAVPTKRKPIIVTVADDALGNIHELATKLAAKGMRVDRVLPITGVISGSYPSDKVGELENIAGVTSVEEEASAELPPTDQSPQ